VQLVLLHLSVIADTHFDSLFFFLMLRPPPRSPLFPYTTLFRSDLAERLTRRSIVVVLGDLFDEPADILNGLKHLRHKRHEVVVRSEEHTSELQSLAYLVCRLLLEKKKHRVPTDDIGTLENAA